MAVFIGFFVNREVKCNGNGEKGFMIKIVKMYKKIIITVLSLLSIALLSGCAARCTDVGYVQPIGYYTYYPTGYMTQDIAVIGP